MNDFWVMVIPLGKENAIHQKDLAARLGMTCSKLRAEIHSARLRGVEICSTNRDGYYFAKDEMERREYVNIQSKQAISRFKTSKAVRRSLREIEGQMEITEDAGGNAE